MTLGQCLAVDISYDICVCQLPLIEDAAVLPEDRDVAEERKRVLECQPIVESMVGSPLVLQELSKVCSTETCVCESVSL